MWWLSFNPLLAEDACINLQYADLPIYYLGGGGGGGRYPGHIHWRFMWFQWLNLSFCTLFLMTQKKMFHQNMHGKGESANNQHLLQIQNMFFNVSKTENG